MSHEYIALLFIIFLVAPLQANSLLHVEPRIWPPVKMFVENMLQGRRVGALESVSERIRVILVEVMRRAE